MRKIDPNIIHGGKIRPSIIEEAKDFCLKAEDSMIYGNIDEAIIRSYPPGVVLKHLKEKCHLVDSIEDFNPKTDFGFGFYQAEHNFIQIYIMLTKKEIAKAIVDRMYDFGWDKSGERVVNKVLQGKMIVPFKHIQFERKFNEDVTEDVEAIGYIYHWTNNKALDKIRRIGLKPSAKSWSGLMQVDNPVDFWRHENENRNWSRIYFSTRKYGIGYPPGYFSPKDNNSGERLEYYLLTIDVDKCPDGTRFYLDPKEENAVYTFNNIPPQAIIQIEDIDGKKLDEELTIFQKAVDEAIVFNKMLEEAYTKSDNKKLSLKEIKKKVKKDFIEKKKSGTLFDNTK